MVSSIEVAEACLKANGQKREPTAFEVSLVTEAEKNRDKLYSTLITNLRTAIDNDDPDSTLDNLAMIEVEFELKKIESVLNQP